MRVLLAGGGTEGGEDGPRVGAGAGFVAGRKLAGDHGRAQLALGEVVGRVHLRKVEKDEEVVALFAQSLSHFFLLRAINAGVRQ